VSRIYLIFLVFFYSIGLFAENSGNVFTFVKIKYSGNWNIHPSSVDRILDFLELTTSIDPVKKVKKLRITDKSFLYFPFIFMEGDKEFSFSEKEREKLREYLLRGGFLWVDTNASDNFYKSLKKEFFKIFPDKKFVKIPKTSAIFYSFYLLPEIGGRIKISDYIYGIDIGGRWAVVVTENDLLGGWAADSFGKWIYKCIPDGEKQRWEGIKLTVNIIMYSLCGTYKLDKIHRPFIERKLK